MTSTSASDELKAQLTKRMYGMPGLLMQQVDGIVDFIVDECLVSLDAAEEGGSYEHPLCFQYKETDEERMQRHIEERINREIEDERRSAEIKEMLAEAGIDPRKLP